MTAFVDSATITVVKDGGLFGHPQSDMGNVGLGIITGINVVSDIRTDEPNFPLVISWAQLALIGVGAYLFSLLTTYLPSRQAARIAPADALRYE